MNENTRKNPDIFTFMYENPVKYDMGSKQLRLRAVKMFDDKEYLWRIS